MTRARIIAIIDDRALPIAPGKPRITLVLLEQPSPDVIYANAHDQVSHHLCHHSPVCPV